MNGRPRGLLTRWPWSVPVLVALLLPASPLVAHEGAHEGPHWPHEGEPIALDGQRIPFYEVFETFLVHASFIYETRGEEAYRTFLTDYGLDPDLEALQALPATFDGLETAGLPGPLRAERLGEIFAAVTDELASDPAAPDLAKKLRFELLDRLRPRMGWVFLGGFPDFPAIDEAEEQFNAAAGGAGSPWNIIEPRSEGAGDETEPHPGVQAKLSYLGDAGEEPPVLPKGGSLATFEWRRYAREDGSVRVIGLIESASQSPSIVDMTFPSDEHLRPEFQHAGIDGLLRFSETFDVPAGIQEKHLTGECLAAQAAAAAACALCVVPSGGELAECTLCAAALTQMWAACNHNHCNQVQCNSNCVQACHLYGYCEGQSCQCVGLRFDIPGCELPEGPDPGCSTTVGDVEMLRLDGGGPVRLPTGPVTLSRLEASDEMHGGEPVSYLMGEWAVVEVGGAGLAAKSAPSVRTLRSSSPEFATSQAEMLRGALPGAAGASSALGEGLALMVAVPPHEANSRQIPMPVLKLSTGGVPVGVGHGRVAVRAEFSGSGELQGFEILADTMGGVPPRLAAHIERALSLQRLTEKEHRVVAFAVLSVGESLEVEADLSYLPKCCCGETFCV